MAKTAPGETIGRLQTVSRLARTELSARLLKHGFYAGQDGVMLALSERDGMTAGGLAAHLGVRPPTITKMVARLAAQGFVKRAASQSDARLALVHLTEAGRNAVSDIRAAIAKSEKAVLKNLPKKDRKAFNKLLGEIEAGLTPKAGDSE